MKSKILLPLWLAFLLCSCGNGGTSSTVSSTKTVSSTTSSVAPSSTVSSASIQESSVKSSVVSSISEISSSSEESSSVIPAQGFNATFNVDEHVTLTVYTTKNYDIEDTDEQIQTRNGDTGEYCNDGVNSQLNFKLVLDEGYELETITATEGTYKNIKFPDETLVENGYRVTKISDDTVITITSKAKQKDPEGFDVTFNVDEHVTLTVYTTKNYDIEDTDEQIQTRNGDTGEYCNDGVNSQLNFKLVLDEGYELETIAATAGTYKNIKFPDETLVENGYRVTKISDDIVITVTAKSTKEESKGFNVTFNVDEHATLIVYTTKNYDVEDTDKNIQTRNGDTGEYCKDGQNSQLNFKLVLDEGYELETITATAGTYKNIKLPDETLVENGYRITKINNDTVITVTCKLIG